VASSWEGFDIGATRKEATPNRLLGCSHRVPRVTEREDFDTVLVIAVANASF
jgi:hypothetical protein